jgi:hypothetical protein
VRKKIKKHVHVSDREKREIEKLCRNIERELVRSGFKAVRTDIVVGEWECFFSVKWVNENSL